MKIMKISTVTDAVLVSSTVPEDDYAAYNPATTYALNDRVILATTHKIYSSLQAGNTGHDPEDDIQNDEDNPPVWWVEVSATNRWMMFDGQRRNQTIGTSPMEVVLSPADRVDSVAILNADASEVSVVVDFEGTEVFNETYEMVQRVCSDWYEFWFKPFETKRNIFITDLPPLIGADVTVTFTKGEALEVAAGIVAIGNSIYLGDAEFGAESDMRSFSKNEPNQFGVSRLVPRTPKLITKQRLQSPKGLTTMLFELREELESVPAIWSTIDDGADGFFPSFILHGIFDRFPINANNPLKTIVELELREI